MNVRLMGNKRAQVGFTVIIVILIALVFIGWLININSRECRSDKECGNDHYCGSDFACHKIPVIEKTVVKRSWTLPILIICSTVVALAMIWKWEILFGNKRAEVNIADTGEKQDSPEAYYTSQFQYTAK